MTICEFLAILSTQVPMRFEQYLTWSSLYPKVSDFISESKYLLAESCDLNESLKCIDKIWDYHIKHKTQILFPHHEQYPSQFAFLKDPPLFLMVQGHFEKNRKYVSVVGSREPSQHVLDWMRTYLPYIVKKDYVIVSGAARGVDLEAHLVSLRSQKPTVAFLPSGLHNIYPKSFLAYQNDILESGGCLISEYDPFKSVIPYHFSQRNRMIASLGLLVLVCEAKLRSGSYMTARLAIESSKTICVLPSFPTDIRNAGGLNLLFEGAFPIRDQKDLLTLLECHQLFIPNGFERVKSENTK